MYESGWEIDDIIGETEENYVNQYDIDNIKENYLEELSTINEYDEVVNVYEPPIEELYVNKNIKDEGYSELFQDNDDTQNIKINKETSTTSEEPTIVDTIETEISYLEKAGIIKKTLNDLIFNVKNIISFKEAYKEYKREHFKLFDLSKIVKKFHIDEKVMKKIGFRETPIITKIDKNKDENDQNDHVGGLFIFMQTSKGGKYGEKFKYTKFTQALLKTCKDLKKSLKTLVKHEQLQEYITFLEEELNKEHKKFLIYIKSSFTVDGKDAGSQIIALVDKELHTIEEKRTEYIYTDSNTKKEKQIHIYMVEDSYNVDVVHDEFRKENFCHSFDKANDFIGEAAHFLLIRYLTNVKFIGTIELSAIHMNGELCRNIYDFDGLLSGIVNNKRMDLYRVYRIIIERCGVVQRSCTLLSLDGRIIKHTWENCDYILQMNPYFLYLKKTSTLILRNKESWAYDQQLKSKYKDEQEIAKTNMKSYLEDNQQIINLMRDFIKDLLIIRPENTVAFAKYYFLSYAPNFLSTKNIIDKEKQDEENIGKTKSSDNTIDEDYYFGEFNQDNSINDFIEESSSENFENIEYESIDEESEFN